MKTNLERHKELWALLYDYYEKTPMKHWCSIHVMKEGILSVWKMNGRISGSPIYNCFLCHEYRDQSVSGYDPNKCGPCPLATREISRPCMYYNDIVYLTESTQHYRGDKKKLLELIAKVRDIVDE